MTRPAILLTIALITSSLGCAHRAALDSAAPTPPPGSLFLYPERISLKDGGFAEAERGLVFVPLDRSAPDRRVIAVEVYRFRAAEDADPGTPPVIRLHGGPGWPGLSRSLERPGNYEENIQPITAVADLVVIGQRGIGSSKPNTVCGGPPSFPLDEETSEEEIAAAYREACAEGKAYWESRGYDLKGLNVVEAAADVRDVCQALGYDKVIITGGSFGSHWGMAVMRFHPEIVERAVLSGMEGPDHTYDMPSYVLNALKRMAAAAETSSELAGHIPDGGLVPAFEAVIARAEKEPILVEVKDPENGEPRTVRFGAEDVRDLALGYSGRASSRRGIRTWPADIIRLHQGDFTAAALNRVRRSGGGGFPTASFFMLDCGSGISAARLAQLEADPANAVVGKLGWFYQTCCPVWESDLGEAFRENFETEIPTLIVHGNWDVSTPIENAEELAPFFKQGKMVVVKGGSHGAMSEALSNSTEFRDALMEFIRTGDLSGMSDEVILPPIEWAVPGPPSP